MKSEIPIHQQENSEDSQSYLQENEQRLKEGCLKVLRILNTGERLTVKSAINQGIASLPRRCLDLKNAGFDIQNEWVRNEKGKRLYKEYFLNITKRPTKEQIIEAFNKGELVQSKLDMK